MLYALKGFIAIHRENGITSASMYCCKALTRYSHSRGAILITGSDILSPEMAPQGKNY
jgi:hypothetical protein